MDGVLFQKLDLVNRNLLDSMSEGGTDRTVFSFGTAGFRYCNDLIDYLAFRSVIFMSWLSNRIGDGFLGVMVTASHNQLIDNGLKIIYPDGLLMDRSDETVIETFVNMFDLKESMEYLMGVKSTTFTFGQFNLCVGYDNRPSSTRISDMIQSTAESLGASVFNIGLTTTPFCYFVVERLNRNSQLNGKIGELNDLYSEMIFGRYLELTNELRNLNNRYEGEDEKLIIDCSHGTGSIILNEWVSRSDCRGEFEIVNGNDPDLLNVDCGAEYTHKYRRTNLSLGDRDIGVSLDGDSDRLVYFKMSDGQLEIADGDKISALFVQAISKLIRLIGIDVAQKAVVMTNYSNSNLGVLARELGFKVETVGVGVKYLIEKSLSYDISVSFESNGHGIYRVSDSLRSELTNKQPEMTTEQKLYCDILLFQSNVT